jgi:hypothetical protein
MCGIAMTGERAASQKVHIFAGHEARTLMEYLVRFLVGGIMVSAFAVPGDVLRPKSFAGLFGAAPSLALATLSLTLWKEGGGYVSVEGRSMILGALALAVYSFAVCQLLMRARCSRQTCPLSRSRWVRWRGFWCRYRCGAGDTRYASSATEWRFPLPAGVVSLL